MVFNQLPTTDKRADENANASQGTATRPPLRLDNLPAEIIEMIASLLEKEELHAFRLTNKALHENSCDAFRHFPYRTVVVTVSPTDIPRQITRLQHASMFRIVNDLSLTCPPLTTPHQPGENFYDELMNLMRPMANLHTIHISCPCLPDPFRAVTALGSFRLRELRLSQGTYDMQLVKRCLAQHAQNLRRFHAKDLYWSNTCWSDLLTLIACDMNLKHVEVDIDDVEEERFPAWTGFCRPGTEKIISFRSSLPGQHFEYDGLKFTATGPEAVKLCALEVGRDLEKRGL